MDSINQKELQEYIDSEYNVYQEKIKLLSKAYQNSNGQWKNIPDNITPTEFNHLRRLKDIEKNIKPSKWFCLASGDEYAYLSAYHNSLQLYEEKMKKRYGVKFQKISDLIILLNEEDISNANMVKSINEKIGELSELFKDDPEQDSKINNLFEMTTILIDIFHENSKKINFYNSVGEEFRSLKGDSPLKKFMIDEIILVGDFEEDDENVFLSDDDRFNLYLSDCVEKQDKKCNRVKKDLNITIDELKDIRQSFSDECDLMEKAYDDSNDLREKAWLAGWPGEVDDCPPIPDSF